MIAISRTARQIKVDNSLLKSDVVSAKVGTIENRNSPETIYIELSFWIKPKDEEMDGAILKRRLCKELREIYTENLSPFLKNNSLFPRYEDNIFIVNAPESINYNKKRNFVSIELYLHTINLISKEARFPLTKHKESRIFSESLNIINSILDTKIMSGQGDFLIYCRK